MNDDIRSRFRGVRRDYVGPIRPPLQQQAPPPPPQPQPQQQPRPIPKPTPAPTLNIFGDPIAPPVSKPLPSVSKAATKRAKPRREKRVSKIGKKTKFILVILILLAIGAGAFWFLKLRNNTNNSTGQSDQSASSINQNTATPTPTGTIKMLMTGDFSAYDTVNSAAKSGDKYNYLPIMTSLKGIFEKYDIRFCNQYTLGGGEELGVSGYPTFNAPTAWSKGLEDLGCNLISVASSHTNDKGQEAITKALNYYDNHKNILAIAGANRSVQEQSKVRYFTLKQVKFAFVAYTTSSQQKPGKPYSVNMYDAATAKKQLEEARKEAQFVIVAMNWGKEDSGDLQPEQEKIAQALVTAGADLVIGNGTHMVQPAKILNGTNKRQGLVWYSLGNAVNSQLPTENLLGGIGVVNIDVATQNMTDPGFIPTYMHYEWSAAEKKAGKLEARKNLSWVALDTAKDLLAKSLTGTTIEAQTNRLKGIITKMAPIKMLKSTEL